MILKTIILTWLLAAGSVLHAEPVTFGTGEVNADAVQVGDQVEVTYRTVDRRSRSRMAEAMGMVTEVGAETFVVSGSEGESIIPYESVIRLDRTRSDAWTLDPRDLALPQGALLEKYLEGRELIGLEGTWVWEDAAYEIALVGNETDRIPRYDYVGIVLATRAEGWASGEVKLLLKETATEGVYSAVFVLGDKSRYGTTVKIDEGRVIEAILPRPLGRRTYKRLIHKTYPIPDPPADTTTVETATRINVGSGFFVTPTVVATVHRLVEDADSITVTFDGRRLPAVVRSRDKRNNIALLTVDVSKLGGSIIVPLALGDPGETLEGDRVVTSGYSSPAAARPSVALATINSLFGPDEDLTRLTLSETLGDHAMGGPVIDTSNRAIGIALPPDTSAATPVNTAIKSDLLGSLLKLSALTPASAPPPSPDGLDPTLIGQMSRSAVVLIKATSAPPPDPR